MGGASRFFPVWFCALLFSLLSVAIAWAVEAEEDVSLSAWVQSVDSAEDGMDWTTAGCRVGNVFVRQGDAHPQDPCRRCDVTYSVSVWAPAPDGTACDDGLFCNGEDACLLGSCNGHFHAPCIVGEQCDEAFDQCLTIEEGVELADDDDEGDDDISLVGGEDADEALDTGGCGA
ncbi:MAG TPA: hypothetical protein PKW95_23590 [bacterium]|nr:hypothetical protein [bacterium]